MKNFFFKLGLYGLLTLVVFTILDVYFTQKMKKSHNYFGEIEVWNEVYHPTQKSDLWLYGSSRSMVHMNSKMIEDQIHVSTYNYGMNGNDIWGQYLRHLELEKNNPLPKNIILSVDTYGLGKSDVMYKSDQLLPYSLFNWNIHKFKNRTMNAESLLYIIPFIRYIGKKEVYYDFRMMDKNPNQKNLRYKGFFPQDKGWNNDFENAKKKGPLYVEIDPVKLNLLNEFIQEMKQKKVNLIFCYTPEYIEGQHFVSNKQEILNIYEGLAKKNNIPYLNFLNHPICKEKKYFYNVTHLNRVGANYFTQELINELKTKKLIKNAF